MLCALKRSALVVTKDGHQATIVNGSQNVYTHTKTNTAIPLLTPRNAGLRNAVFTAGQPHSRTSGAFQAVVEATGAELWERTSHDIPKSFSREIDLYSHIHATNKLPDMDSSLLTQLDSLALAGFVHALTARVSDAFRFNVHASDSLRSQSSRRAAELYDDYVEQRIALQRSYEASGANGNAKKTAAFTQSSETRKQVAALTATLTRIAYRLVAMLDAAVAFTSVFAMETHERTDNPTDEARAARIENRWDRRWSTKEPLRPIVSDLTTAYLLGMSSDWSSEYASVDSVAYPLDDIDPTLADSLSGIPPALADDNGPPRAYIRDRAFRTAVASRCLKQVRKGLTISFDGGGTATELLQERMDAANIPKDRQRGGLWAKNVEALLADGNSQLSSIHAALEALALHRHMHDGNDPPVSESFGATDDMYRSTAMAAVLSRHRPRDLQNSRRSAMDIVETTTVPFALEFVQKLIARPDAWSAANYTLNGSDYFPSATPLTDSAKTFVDHAPLELRDHGGASTAAAHAWRVYQAAGGLRGAKSMENVEIDETRPLAPIVGNLAPKFFPVPSVDSQTAPWAAALDDVSTSLRHAMFWSPVTPMSASCVGFFNPAAWRSTTLDSSRQAEKWPNYSAAAGMVARESMRAGLSHVPPLMDAKGLAAFYRAGSNNLVLYVLAEFLDEPDVGSALHSRAYFTRMAAFNRASQHEGTPYGDELYDKADKSVRINDVNGPSTLRYAEYCLKLLTTWAPFSSTTEYTTHAIADQSAKDWLDDVIMLFELESGGEFSRVEMLSHIYELCAHKLATMLENTDIDVGCGDTIARIVITEHDVDEDANEVITTFEYPARASAAPIFARIMSSILALGLMEAQLLLVAIEDASDVASAIAGMRKTSERLRNSVEKMAKVSGFDESDIFSIVRKQRPVVTDLMR